MYGGFVDDSPFHKPHPAFILLVPLAKLSLFKLVFGLFPSKNYQSVIYAFINKKI